MLRRTALSSSIRFLDQKRSLRIPVNYQGEKRPELHHRLLEKKNLLILKNMERNCSNLNYDFLSWPRSKVVDTMYVLP